MREYLPPLNDAQLRWARFLGLIAGVWLLWWMCQRLSGVLTPLAIGLALAYTLNPAVTWLERRRRVPRVWSVSFGLAILGLGLAVFLLQWTVQTIDLLQTAPQYVAKLVAWTKHTLTLQPWWWDARHALSFAASAPAESAPVPSRPVHNPLDPQQLRELAQQYAPAVGQVIRPTYDFLASQIANVTHWLTLFVLIPLYTFVFLLHFNQIVQAIHDLLPADYRSTIVRIVTTIDLAIADFFRGRVVVCAAVGVLSIVGWGLVGLEGNVLFGVLTGLLNLIPYVSGVVLIPALLVAYFGVEPGESWVMAVTAVFAVFMIVQAIESFVLSPIVLSQSSGLHPLTTVVALLVGAEVAGLLGMLLAIPLASTLKSLGKEYVLPELQRLAAERAAAASTPAVSDAPPAGAAKAGEAGSPSGGPKSES